ncbi:hypothetical protein DSM106972_009190 [Dulcicalothrix desertica PCC 7102]|uniref:Ribbon-helix-helix protein CopG domain-containing protein n=1 Tax=Dulcicalothrix desertica PCC 7102 TaxID=232991 RepID=A0A433VRZ0_9CYAN|nr:hypothetical protein [Dulcicalothrix desertica]RUT08866.1 hypothetical protein DSM106972_009190 [Dulcicalothrix desertica PCC 7102]TWH44118.1 hypothetical protein CAL7102_07896 [Dulcicalothrix desertica PCC 7102]
MPKVTPRTYKLYIRLSTDELAELTQIAANKTIPVSTLVRSIALEYTRSLPKSSNDTTSFDIDGTL